MGRFANSWAAVKASWGVLRQDKELIFFPVLAGICSIVLMALFAVPGWTSGIFDRAYDGDPEARAVALAGGWVFFVLSTFIVVYFNSALVHAANERLSGGDPNVGSGLRGANQRLAHIFGWSIFAGTVGFLLYLLEQLGRRQGGAAGFATRFVAQLLGAGWNVAVFFVVPVLVLEGKGVFESFKRSAQILTQKWGETLIGGFGVRIVFSLATFLWVLLFIMLVFVALPAGPLAVIALIVVGILGAVLIQLVGNALGTVYKAVLYRYATQNQIPTGFPEGLVKDPAHPTWDRSRY